MTVKSKVCNKCSKRKKLTMFNKHKLTKDNLENACKVCTRKQSQSYRKSNPEICKTAKQRWKSTNSERESLNNKGHNLTKYWPNLSALDAVKKYDALFQNQNGKCKICQRHQSEFKKALHVDHNHKTKKIRGLLCFSCNSILGHAKEDPIVLMTAVDYLRYSGDE